MDQTTLDRNIDAYFDAIGTRSADAIGEVFEQAAVLDHPGGLCSGRDAIVAFYVENNLIHEHFAVDESQRLYGSVSAAVELVLHLDDIATNVGAFFNFSVDDRIQRLAIYTR